MSRLSLAEADKLPSRSIQSAKPASQCTSYLLHSEQVRSLVQAPISWLQAAKSLGSSLRGVAPFVKEIAGAGTELKRALEEEIGLDDIRNEWRGQGPYPSSSALNSFQGQAESKPSAAKEAAVHEGGTASPAPPGTEAPRLTQVTENMAKTVDPQIDQKRKASEAAAWGSNAPAAAQEEKQQATGGEASSLQGLSMEDLEAELARRKQERQKARKA